MCKSISEGGQRCAAHTRAAYSAALRHALKHPGAEADQKVFNAAVAYASTRAGAAAFTTDAELAEEAGDFEAAAQARTVVMWGTSMRAANQEARQMMAPVDRCAEQTFVVDGEQVRVMDGVLDESAQRVFRGDQGFALATAMSRQTGWSVLVRERVLPGSNVSEYSHSWVESPDGQWLDIDGPRGESPVQAEDLDRDQQWRYRRVSAAEVDSATTFYRAAGLAAPAKESAEAMAKTVLRYHQRVRVSRTNSERWRSLDD